MTSDSDVEKEYILAESHFEPVPFGTKYDGWGHQGDCTLTLSPTEGNPGACLKAVDAVTGDVFYYRAPKKFLDDKKSAFRLEYDIKWVASARLPIFPWDRVVEISGSGTVLIYNAAPPTRNEWVHSVVLFQPIAGLWKNVTANRPATVSDFENVLSSLEKLIIRGEFAHGGPETGFLDNVVLYGR